MKKIFIGLFIFAMLAGCSKKEEVAAETSSTQTTQQEQTADTSSDTADESGDVNTNVTVYNLGHKEGPEIAEFVTKTDPNIVCVYASNSQNMSCVHR